jgi:hypothetical protein
MADYYTHKYYMELYRALHLQYPMETQWIQVGQTYLDVASGDPNKTGSIWMLSVGNSNGGPVLLDSNLHGMEDMGTLVFYYYAKWILDNHDTDQWAHDIFTMNRTLIIPVVNNFSYYDASTDSWVLGVWDTVAIEGKQPPRGNRNLQPLPYGCPQPPWGGVDLNRNFVQGWQGQNPSACISGCSSCYRGFSAGSEPETQTMRNVFNTYLASKPKSAYANSHFGGGPWIMSSSYVPQAIRDQISTRMVQIADEMGISNEMQGADYVYRHRYAGATSGPGYACSDAAAIPGCASFAWEMFGAGVDGHGPCKMTDGIPNPFEGYKDCLLTAAKPVIFAMSEYCAIIPTTQLCISTTVGGTVTPDCLTCCEYIEGEAVTIEAHPTVGYYFDHWDGAVTGTTNPTIVRVTGITNIIATFSPLPSGADDVKTFTINIASQGDAHFLGTISITPQIVTYGGQVVIHYGIINVGETDTFWGGLYDGGGNLISNTLWESQTIPSNGTYIPQDIIITNIQSSIVNWELRIGHKE